jgi:hypothetical protein
MLVSNYIIILLLIVSLGILYQLYNEKQAKYVDIDGYKDIKQYLLKEKSLDKSKKPILWIYVPHDYNSRHWLSFGSRSSFELNQPYLYLTVKSIIKNCDKSFKIVLIDDGSFEKLIPKWNINLAMLSDPMKSYIRQLAMAKLIYTYGGINVPISFLCFRDLIGLYNRGTNDDTPFVCENTDMNNIASTNHMFYPDSNFMGAQKHNETIKKYINFLEQKISEDYTDQTKFLGDFDKWCNAQITAGKMRLIPGTEVGTKTVDDEPVIVETLLGEDYIHFYGKLYGIWIPDKMILKRQHYNWFARMSPEQIFQSQIIIAKYMVLALAPDSHMGIIEPLQNQPDWISFWKVPLTHGTLNLWGPMPQNLGNNVPRSTTTGNMN